MRRVEAVLWENPQSESPELQRAKVGQALSPANPDAPPQNPPQPEQSKPASKSSASFRHYFATPLPPPQPPACRLASSNAPQSPLCAPPRLRASASKTLEPSQPPQSKPVPNPQLRSAIISQPRSHPPSHRHAGLPARTPSKILSAPISASPRLCVEPPLSGTKPRPQRNHRCRTKFASPRILPYQGLASDLTQLF
jgi:hypothetical protein